MQITNQTLAAPAVRIFAAWVAILIAVSPISCGVKGSPLPPDTPPEIGRGRPENSAAFEELAIPAPPSPTPKANR